MAKKKIAQEVVDTQIVETAAPVTENETVTVVEEAPVAIIASAAPTKQKGRPIVQGSVRQLKLAERAERVQNGGKVERGRPTNASSARQMKFAAKAALIASGVVIKPGRPKMIKPEVTTAVAEVTEAVEA